LILSHRVWTWFLIFLSVAKLMTFFAAVADLSGGMEAWCDCFERNYSTPFQQHKHGFGLWYQILIWIHVIFAGIIFFPLLISMFSPKGSKIHIYSGFVYLGCWIVHIILGVSTGGFAQIARGAKYPGEDASDPATNHWWGTFGFYIFILFSFILSSVCEQLLNGVAAIQFRNGKPPKHQYQMLQFGSFMTILNGMTILTLGTFTLANHPEPGSTAAFYPWLYYIFIPVELVMAGLNLKYWNSTVEERGNMSLVHHIRCMTWSGYLTFFFILENVTYKIINLTGASMWLLIPVFIINVILFGSYIFYYLRQVETK